jgi:hypothetical protein
MSADDDALKRVDEFEADGSGAGVWRAIRKDEVVAGLRERIRNKDGLNQHNTGLCAVAALVHIELQDDPKSYVELAVGLYKGGQASWRGSVVRPNNDLLANPPPDGLIVNGTAQTFNRADWIVMSSIRNTINPADNYNRSSGDGTMMNDLEAFVRQVGYTKVEADYSMDSWSKNRTNAEKATALLRLGYRVILFISAAMLRSANQSDWGGEVLWVFPKPNHFVQLVAGIDIFNMRLDIPIECNTGFGETADVVSFDVYTWADGHRHVPEDPNIPLKLRDFLWNYYGYLAFKD